MLKNTFCHIPRISEKKELQLWQNGIHSWEQLPNLIHSNQILKHLEDSYFYLENNDPYFFAENLPTKEHWRLFHSFRHMAAYLDIETTGLFYSGSYITTIAIYDGKEIKYFVNGDNLHEFPFAIEKYKLLITYNGKQFDLPFIEKFFGMKLNVVQIDLRYLLKSLGFTGGLKNCEKKLGIERDELSGIDGNFAVYLWKDYKVNKNQKALETLLAYNIQDVLNLELLMVEAYNMKLQNTPFAEIYELPNPVLPSNPFKVDLQTVERLRRKISNWGFGRY